MMTIIRQMLKSFLYKSKSISKVEDKRRSCCIVESYLKINEAYFTKKKLVYFELSET